MNYVMQERWSTTCKKLYSAQMKSALMQAVKNGHLVTWPGLNRQAINKHLRMTPITAMEHMNQ
jgi:hypothetical protein